MSLVRRQRPLLLGSCSWGCLALLAVLSTLEPCRAGLDRRLKLGPFFFNPSVVHYEGQYYATARTAYMKAVQNRWWWFNGGYICRSRDANFSSPVCSRFDPWQGDFRECLWGGLVDTKGIEDPKLFVWPGKGMYALFGRKPEAPGQQQQQQQQQPNHSSSSLSGPAPLCSLQQPWLQQYLVSVKVQGEPGDWTFRRPVPLKVAIPGFYDERIRAKAVIKEKNWMPLVYQDQLFMVHSIMPMHRVLQLGTDGQARQQLVSNSSGILSDFRAYDVHGGPPVIHIPAHLSPTGRSYYLGVLHYFKWDKSGGRDIKYYYHYAYKMQDRPPFAICAVSQEVPLVFLKHRRRLRSSGQQQGHHRIKPEEEFKNQRIWKDTSHTAFVNGLFLDTSPGPTTALAAAAAAGAGSSSGSSRAVQPQLLISYGCSDVDSRMLRLTLNELELLFRKQQYC